MTRDSPIPLSFSRKIIQLLRTIKRISEKGYVPEIPLLRGKLTVKRKRSIFYVNDLYLYFLSLKVC